jgi:chromosome partitioning protein
MTIIIACHNEKGGVGKTTTSVCLGGALAEEGLAVMIIDLDPQGDASAWLGADHPYTTPISDVLTEQAEVSRSIEQTGVDGLEIIPATGDLKSVDPTRSIDSIADETGADVVLVDCPPQYDPSSPHTTIGVEAADVVLVPLTPSVLELHGLERTREYVEASLGEDRDDEWHALLSRVDYRASITEEVEGMLRRSLPTHACPVTIGENATIRDAPTSNLPITHHDNNSRGARDFRALADWTIEEVL